MSLLQYEIITITAVIGLTIIIILYISRLFNNVDSDKSAKDRVEINSVAGIQGATNKAGSKKVNSKEGRTKKKSFLESKHKSYSHPWLMTTLKGHSGKVYDFDFSENGKYIATCSEDETVLLWLTKDFKNKDHKSVRCNIEYDYATQIQWSPDCKAFIVLKQNENTIEVYKLNKKQDGGIGNIQAVSKFNKPHEADIIGIGISSNGKFIMTCSDKTDITVYNLKGTVLATVDTYLMSNHCGKVSPCGRYIAASGFTPDVKVWEVKFNKSGDFEKVQRAFELGSHESGVYSFDFNSDSSKMATVSKDGTWKIFNTKVDYTRGQTPYLILSQKYEGDFGIWSKIAYSPDGHVVAIAKERVLYLYSATSGNLIEKIHEPHFSEHISRVQFDAHSKYFITCGDRHIQVFHNVPGYQEKVQDLKNAQKTAATSAQKERIKQQIQEAEAMLKKF